MKKMLHLSKYFYTFCLLLCLFATDAVIAQVTIFTRANGNWNSVNTWLTTGTSGTITTATSSKTVTGTGTSFTTEAVAGAVLYGTNGTTPIGIISTIQSNTSLTLSNNALINNSNAGYTLRKVPVAGDIVTITNGKNITVTAAASCASLTMDGGAVSTRLTINSGQSLIVSGAATIGGGTVNGSDIMLNVGSGNFSSASLTINMAATGDNNTNSELAIGTGTATVSGNITMNGTALRNAIRFYGAGTLNVGGNISSGGDIIPFSTTAGLVNYNGTSGTQTVKADIYADITFSGGAAKQLAGAATVTDVCTFSNGILTTTSSKLLIINPTGSVSGVSDASFVDGPVKRKGAIGAGGFNFPVGKTGIGYMKIGIANITGATTEFTAQYFRGSARTAFGTAGLVALGIQAVSNCEYWTLNREVTASSADVTLSWNFHSPCGVAYIVEPAYGIRIVRYNTQGAKWDAHGGGSVSGNASAGSVTWTGVGDFSQFALGGVFGSQSFLPVMFSNVKAYEKNNGVQIEWSNLTERDLVKYVVERSSNGQNYSAISEQLPRSNSNEKESYSAFDASAFSGINFYRIKVFEINGKVIYSKVLKVDIRSGQQGFALYPNPVSGTNVSVSINPKQQGQYSLKVLNTEGQEMYSQKFTHQGGSVTMTIGLPSAVKPGVYTMMISGENYREAKIFIVQ